MNDLDWLCRNVHECLSYNPESGDFVWRTRPLNHFKSLGAFKSWNSKFSGCVAGNKTFHKDNQYISIRINGKSYKAHRIAILMSYGFWPKEVDHYNGIHSDNKLSNLIPCERSFNAKNLPTRKDSKIMGVKKDRNKYRARINVNHKEITIGTFDDFFEACCARKSAENQYGFGAKHGRY